MPATRMTREDFQDQRRRVMQRQVSNGLRPFVLKQGAISFVVYMVILAIYLAIRGRAYIAMRGTLYWVFLAAIMAISSVIQPILNFYSIKRQLKNAELSSIS
jgi:hypothetical protein